ncbi:MAG: NUDIX domain-containing protein [Myxococcales bacterium]|nr:NUDIX domain-containing protein [Myxococcales bacterium]
MTADPHAHCGYCGAAFPAGVGWPRDCVGCLRRSYRNPIPVAVLLVPVADGVLIVRRAIEPRLGWWALPGGFLEAGESWRVGAARELREETGITISPSALDVYEVHTTEDGRLLLLFCTPTGPGFRALPSLPAFAGTPEVTALDVLRAPRELAFPLHSEVSARYLVGDATR